MLEQFYQSVLDALSGDTFSKVMKSGSLEPIKRMVTQKYMESEVLGKYQGQVIKLHGEYYYWDGKYIQMSRVVLKEQLFIDTYLPILYEIEDRIDLMVKAIVVKLKKPIEAGYFTFKKEGESFITVMNGYYTNVTEDTSDIYQNYTAIMTLKTEKEMLKTPLAKYLGKECAAQGYGTAGNVVYYKAWSFFLIQENGQWVLVEPKEATC